MKALLINPIEKTIEELKSRIKFHGRRFIEHNGHGFTTKAWEDA